MLKYQSQLWGRLNFSIFYSIKESSLPYMVEWLMFRSDWNAKGVIILS